MNLRTHPHFENTMEFRIILAATALARCSSGPFVAFSFLHGEFGFNLASFDPRRDVQGLAQLGHNNAMCKTARASSAFTRSAESFGMHWQKKLLPNSHSLRLSLR